MSNFNEKRSVSDYGNLYQDRNSCERLRYIHERFVDWLSRSLQIGRSQFTGSVAGSELTLNTPIAPAVSRLQFVRAGEEITGRVVFASQLDPLDPEKWVPVFAIRINGQGIVRSGDASDGQVLQSRGEGEWGYPELERLGYDILDGQLKASASLG